MDQLIKEIFQVAAWSVAVIGGLIAAGKAISELRDSTQQKKRDLRWRQAEMAKQLLDELFGSLEARAALKMLDWDGLPYKTPDGGTTQPITHKIRRDSLRTQDPVFRPGEDGPFIRDAYDALFDSFERLEHFIRIELIQFEDVAPVLRYYVSKMWQDDERKVVKSFLDAYGFARASDFLNRFQELHSLSGTGPKGHNSNSQVAKVR
jgi:hypothetical protein